jgi:hypothetical protein
VVVGDRLETLASKEDRHELAAASAFTAEPDPFVVGQVGRHVAKL